MPKVVKVLLVVVLIFIVLIPLVLLGTCSVAGGIMSMFSGFMWPISSGFTGRWLLGMVLGVLTGILLIFLGVMFWKLTARLKRKGDEFLKK